MDKSGGEEPYRRPARGFQCARANPHTAQLVLDFVTDADFAEVVGWQDMQWKANLEAARKIESIENRIKNGAQIVAKNYYFDPKRHLVRSKKNAAASGE